MVTNEFAKISKLVDTIITSYREVKKECGILDEECNSHTIEHLSAPFIDGYFTLAVVGKVSSGKSTFINALLGCKDLLPTGHNQTTCGLTYIEYGETPEVTIRFGDEHEAVIKDDIGGKIKQYVALPEKYRYLPVNNIDDMILVGYDFNKIWEVRDKLEEETLCLSIDKSLLKEYVEHREKKDIAVEVRIKYPFNEELKGWRVIDTPGIGAIGGIETRTKQLLDKQKEDGSREVDAILFLQDGSKTLDESDTKKFVKETLENFTKSDKDRLFYVLTHSGSTDFVDHKNGKIEFIRLNYGNKIKVLTYADSLRYSFLTYIHTTGDSLDDYEYFSRPNNWAEDEWHIIKGILHQAKDHLAETHDSFNHDTMLRTVREWAHFEELKNEINTFAKNKKLKTLYKLFELVAKDYQKFIQILELDKNLVDNGLNSINNEIKKVEEKRIKYSQLSQKADNIITRDRIKDEFDDIDKDLSEKIDSLKSIARVETYITDFRDLVQKRQREVLDDIINQFYDFFKDYSYNDPVFESIDCEAIETESERLIDKDIYRTRSSIGKVIPAKYDKTRIEAEKLRNFKRIVKVEVKKRKDKYISDTQKVVDNMRKVFFNNLNTIINGQKERYEGLKSDLNRKNELKAEKDERIAKIKAAFEEFTMLTKDL